MPLSGSRVLHGDTGVAIAQTAHRCPKLNEQRKYLAHPLNAGSPFGRGGIVTMAACINTLALGAIAPRGGNRVAGIF
jgi:hypothetical protein